MGTHFHPLTALGDAQMVPHAGASRQHRPFLHALPTRQVVNLIYAIEAAMVDTGAGFALLPADAADAILRMLRDDLRRRELVLDDGSFVGGRRA